LSRFKKISLLLASIITVIIIAFLVLIVMHYDPTTSYELRGHYQTSIDSKTYLIIEDNNGGQCGPLMVDNRIWPHAIHAKAVVNPGPHSIACGSGNSLEISIKQGTTYYFDYWGP